MNIYEPGSIQYVRHMGSDRTIAEAAWASTAASEGRTDADVARVVRWLARSDPPHWTPFATGAQITFRIRMPSFLWNQWRRHMAGFARVDDDDLRDIADSLHSYNAESRRYTDPPPKFMEVPHDFWRQRAEGKKSGSSDKPLHNGPMESQDVARHQFLVAAERYYAETLARGVSPEQARMDLPQSLMTTHVETASLYGYARVALHRISKDAEGPIVPYAREVDRVLGELFPVAWPALTRKLEGKTLAELVEANQ